MCTVTIIPFPAPKGPGFRLVTNRDELRSRAVALPPAWHATDGGGMAMYPVDPTGGGTWVAVSRRGLVLTLLNANPLPAPKLPPRDDLVSRGTIIPRLIDGESVEGAMEGLGALELGRYAPFRLVGVAMDDRAGFMATEATWDRAALKVERLPAGLVCLVSSGLGDPLVKPRLALFEELLAGPARRTGEAVTREEQDRFHRHAWGDRPEISVLMRRADARTVSITAVEVGKGARVGMAYEAVPDESVRSQGTGVRSGTGVPGAR